MKLNICYISREYPPVSHIGGIGTYTQVIAEGLAGIGHNIHVICATPDAAEDFMQNQVFVHRIPIHPFLWKEGRWRYPLRFVERKFLFDFLEDQAWSYGAAAELEELLKNEPIQIVEYPETNAEGFFISKNSSLRRVCRLHIGGLTESASNLSANLLSRKKIQKMEKASIFSAHRITCPSQALADFTGRQLQIDPSKISVFPNPLDSLFTQTGPKIKNTFDYHFLFVGRIERRKGVEILLSAFINLLDQYPQSRLRLVGQDYGNYYDPVRKIDLLKELQKKYNLGSSLEFIPRVERKTLLEHFAWADIVIVPSINENLPYVVLEAMSQGKGVIASDCGGIPEMIEDGKTGILFPTGDIAGLSSSLLGVCGNPQSIPFIGALAAEKIRKEYSMEALLPRIEKIYAEAIGS